MTGKKNIKEQHPKAVATPLCSDFFPYSVENANGNINHVQGISFLDSRSKVGEKFFKRKIVVLC